MGKENHYSRFKLKGGVGGGGGEEKINLIKKNPNENHKSIIYIWVVRNRKGNQR